MRVGRYLLSIAVGGLTLFLTAFLSTASGTDALQLSSSKRPGMQQMEANDKDWAETTHKQVSSKILDSARWLDSFFDDDRTRLEENHTQVKILMSSLWEDSEDIDLKLRLSLRLALPAAENRLNLFISGVDDEDDVDFDRDPRTQSIRRSESGQADLGFNYFFKAAKKRNIRGTVRFRYRNDEIVVIPELRWRETVPTASWVWRFAESVRWYSDTGWETRTTIDLDRKVYRDYLLRTSVEGFWSEEEEDEKGFIYAMNVTLSRALGPRQAISFDWLNSFQTKPSNHLENLSLQVRYRRNIKWKWLFLEVVPRASFPREANRRFKPSILVLLEAVLGYH